MKRRENIEGESGSEYLVQEREHFLRGGVVDFTQPLYEACFVHGANLGPRRFVRIFVGI
jgi:hypothetical protein